MMRGVLVCILLLITTQAQARERERVLSTIRYESKFIIAGYIVQCDTISLVHKSYPKGFEISTAHFGSNRATHSLFNEYMRNTRKQDSLDEVKRKKTFDTYVKTEQAKARKQHKPIPAFVMPARMQYAILFDDRNVKRYRIKVTDIIKKSPVNDSAGPEVKTLDTITVLVVPRERWDTTSGIDKGRIVVYNVPFDNKERVLDERYFTAQMLEFYRHEKIYFIAPGNIEEELWRDVDVQY